MRADALVTGVAVPLSVKPQGPAEPAVFQVTVLPEATPSPVPRMAMPMQVAPYVTVARSVPTGVTVYWVLLHTPDTAVLPVPVGDEAQVPLRAVMAELVAEADVVGDVGDAIGELLHADARTEANARRPRALRRIRPEYIPETRSSPMSVGIGARRPSLRQHAAWGATRCRKGLNRPSS